MSHVSVGVERMGNDEAILCDLQCSRTVNFAAQQNDIPIVKRLRITNAGSARLDDVRISLAVEPDFAVPWEARLASFAPGEVRELAPLDLMLSPDYLASVTERTAGVITLTVTSQDNELLRQAYGIDVLAYDEWGGISDLPELLAAFVAPNHPVVAGVIHEASALLDEWTQDPSLDGYQRGDVRRARLMLAAIYTVLRSRQIVYCVPPASFEERGQRIRTPDVIADTKLGTCLDLTLFFAACAEAAGLHPLLVITPGHSFVGAWLVDESFSEALQDDVTALSKRVAAGVNEICVVETTALCAGQAVEFEQAVGLAQARIHQFICMIDVRRARAASVRPLPLRSNGRIIMPDDDVSGGTKAFVQPDLADSEHYTLPTAQAQAGAERVALWERRLLDLSLRNQLLNYRHTGGTVPLLVADLSGLEDHLADNQELEIGPRPSDWDGTERSALIHRISGKGSPQAALLNSELAQRRLRADLNAQELEAKLVQLFRSARTSLEENGANTLYLSLGLLVWREIDKADTDRFAPLILIPVEIVRRPAHAGYVIRQRDEEARFNITLLELLRKDFGLEISGVDPLPQDEHGISVTEVLAYVRQAVKHRPGWDVREEANLGILSFDKFVMWHDLRERLDVLKENKIVSALIAGHLAEPLPDTAIDGPLDEACDPGQDLTPLSADSSQLAAIHRANAGASFVLHGPPGTGKSQTITNIIANAMAAGKRVLFVAEKMAALSVVQKRLDEIGLGPFCLELHSNKARKLDVITHLGKALGSVAEPGPESWQAQAERLAGARNKLNRYVTALHARRPIGISVYQGLSKLAALRDAPPTVRFTASQIENLSPDQLLKWHDAVRRLVVAGRGVGHPYGHLWRLAACSEYSNRLKESLAVSLEDALRTVGELRTAAMPVTAFFVCGEAPSRQELVALDKLSELVATVPAIPYAAMSSASWPDDKIAISGLMDHGRRRAALRVKLHSRYTESVLQVDAAALQSELVKADTSWFLPRFLGRRAVARALRPAMRNPRASVQADMAEDLKAIAELRREEESLRAADANGRTLLGQLWSDGEPDWDRVERAIAWVDAFRAVALALANDDPTQARELRTRWADRLAESRERLAQGSALQNQLAHYRGVLNRCDQAWQQLCSLLSVGPEDPIDVRTADWCGQFSALLSTWRESLPQLPDWCAWQRARNEALDLGLLPVVTPYEQGVLKHGQVEASFERALYQTWAAETIDHDQDLRDFHRPTFEHEIEEFRRLDDILTGLTRREIAARVAARVPRGVAAATDSELWFLRHELGKQKRHVALRTLFQKIPNVLPRITPCLLMSPISVAQYLDPAFPPFDLIIFDEASQVPTCEAVGALARGTQTVIVGDPKQLPPTSFFMSSDANEDEVGETPEDLESILDDCQALGMPEEHLRWHYRSRHESLIAFSNYQYYRNSLQTFPSPDDLKPAVRLVSVSGIYDKGRSRQNRAEAEKVVREIIRRLSDPVLCRQSIGVVAFNQPQQRLIEDLLEAERSRRPELEPFFNRDSADSVFVKNLENVQGDERDVIMFSVGYGPDAQGRVSMNFGPLNKHGGERRLNVAVTRARRELIVFSSLSPDQIDLRRTKAKAVQDLKAFLEYARDGKRALAAQLSMAADADHESILEEQIAVALRERGHVIHAQVGCSGYRIDLGVVDPDAPGRYILGIECDGATYHSAQTARDRDKLREAVLRGLGWRIHRVWSTDWWNDPAMEIERIQAAIEAAKVDAKADIGLDAGSKAVERADAAVHDVAATDAAVKVASMATVSVAPAAANPQQPDVGVAYIPAILPRVEYVPESFYEDWTRDTIRKQIETAVTKEGPVSFDLLCRRITAAWGLGRAGSRITDRIRTLSRSLSLVRTRSDERTFLWPTGMQPEGYREFRTNGLSPDSQRDAIDLPPEEVANAMLVVLRAHISLTEEALIRETARAFGYQKTGKNVARYLAHGINVLLKRGKAQRNGMNVIIKE